MGLIPSKACEDTPWKDGDEDIQVDVNSNDDDEGDNGTMEI